MRSTPSKIMKRHQANAKKGRRDWPLEEEDIRNMLENSWRDSARSIVGNWIGLVYQLTNMDRRLPFMDFVDPEHPLATI